MVRLATALFTVFCFVACSSFPDGVPPEEQNKDQNGTSPTPSGQLPPSSPKSGPSSSSSSSGSSTPSETSPSASDAGAQDAASSSDASASTTTKDAAPASKLAFGQPCTDHAQCAGGICLPFENKGFRCTKVCSKDSDCPSNDCKDDPEVCDVD